MASVPLTFPRYLWMVGCMTAYHLAYNFKRRAALDAYVNDLFNKILFKNVFLLTFGTSEGLSNNRRVTQVGKRPCRDVDDEIIKGFEGGVLETPSGLELLLGVLSQEGQDFVWHDRPDILLTELFIDPGQEQNIVLDCIFYPSLIFGNQ